MPLPQLNEFISGRKWGNSFIQHPDWRALYIRVTERYIHGKKVPTIDLASIEARMPGNGAFRRLVDHLHRTYMTRGIFVESVLTKRFAEGLKRMGFEEIHPELPAPSFYFPAKQPESEAWVGHGD